MKKQNIAIPEVGKVYRRVDTDNYTDWYVFKVIEVSLSTVHFDILDRTKNKSKFKLNSCDSLSRDSWWDVHSEEGSIFPDTSFQVELDIKNWLRN